MRKPQTLSTTERAFSGGVKTGPNGVQAPSGMNPTQRKRARDAGFDDWSMTFSKEMRKLMPLVKERQLKPMDFSGAGLFAVPHRDEDGKDREEDKGHPGRPGSDGLSLVVIDEAFADAGVAGEGFEGHWLLLDA